MKKHLLPLIACITIALLANNGLKAQTLIHYWHFNNFTGSYNLPNIPGVDADYSVLDTTKAKIAYEKLPGTILDSAYLDGYATSGSDYDTANLLMGAISGTALRTRNPGDSMQLLFYIPTTGYQNIDLKYACEKSSNGMTTQNFDYSTDSGATWVTSGLPITSFTNTTTFSLVDIAFTDAAVNNNPRLVFRVTFSGNSIGTSGNNRFDNVSVEGNSTTAVNNVSSAVAHFSLYPNPANNTLNILSTTDGMRTITIYDMEGRAVYTGNTSNKQYTVNTASLNAGYYIVRITDLLNGSHSELQFVKK